MSSTSSQGLIGVLTAPANRILQDLEQVTGFKAAVADAPLRESTGEPQKDSGGTEKAQSQGGVQVPPGVIRGVRAAAPSSGARADAPAPGTVSEPRVRVERGVERPEGQGLAHSMRPAPELVRAPEGVAEASGPLEIEGRLPPATLAGQGTLPRLILRRDRPLGIRPLMAAARAGPPGSVPAGLWSEVAGREAKHEAGSASVVSTVATSGGDARPVRVAWERGILAQLEGRLEAGVGLSAMRQSVAAPAVRSEPSQAPVAVGHPGMYSPLSSVPAAAHPSVAPVMPVMPVEAEEQGGPVHRMSEQGGGAGPSAVRSPEVAPAIKSEAPTALVAVRQPKVPGPVRGEPPQVSVAVAQPEVSSSASSAPPVSSSSGFPAASALPRLVFRREPAVSERSRLSAVAVSSPELEVLAQEPTLPPMLTPSASSQVHGALKPPIPLFTDVESLMEPGASAPAKSVTAPMGESPPERLAGESTPPPSPAMEAASLDREQLKELLIDILQDAARVEGVEV